MPDALTAMTSPLYSEDGTMAVEVFCREDRAFRRLLYELFSQGHIGDLLDRADRGDGLACGICLVLRHVE